MLAGIFGLTMPDAPVIASRVLDELRSAGLDVGLSVACFVVRFVLALVQNRRRSS